MTTQAKTQVRVRDTSTGFDDEEEAILHTFRMNRSGNPTTIVMETYRGPVEIRSGPVLVSRSSAGIAPGKISVEWDRKVTSFTRHRKSTPRPG